MRHAEAEINHAAVAPASSRYGKWISDETERKERDFRGILRMHVNICKGILSRTASITSYLYVDLYAGPGNLEHKGRRFDGSPLIARDLLTQAGVPYQAEHWECHPDAASLLGEALSTPASLLDALDVVAPPIHVEDCRTGFNRWLDACGPQPDRLGLVYADPIGTAIPVDTLNRAATMLPRVDLLSYVSATNYKRGRRLNPGLPYLADDIGAVNKRCALIREGERSTGFGWTFVLWTNWADFPAWTNAGFHRVDSPRGQAELERLNLTRPELHAKTNTPLPVFDNEGSAA